MEGFVGKLLLWILDKISGVFRVQGNKEAAIKQKNEIYMPLLEELKPWEIYDWNIVKDVSTPLLERLVCDNYQYAIDEELFPMKHWMDINMMKKCLLNQYNILGR